MKGTFPRVTHPSATISFDLHVLSLPPAFVLSQNQTLKLSVRPDILFLGNKKQCLLFDGKPVRHIQPKPDTRTSFP